MDISPAFPASIETLCLWISSIAAAPYHLKIGTCKVYISGVINAHIERGFNNPLENAPPMLDRILTGIKRYAAHQHNNIDRSHNKPKLPITTAMLRSFASLLDDQHRSDALVLAMMWVATTGMLRISEFTVDNKDNDHLLSLSQLSFRMINDTTMNALSIDNTENIKHAVLHLHASKTDPFRLGVEIIIASKETINALCSYLAHIKQRPVQLHSPLFSFKNGEPVNRNWFMKQITTLLTKTGYNYQHYSSHSFRKGGAVSLQQSGIEDSIIRKLGRWKSDAYHLYLRHPANESIINASARI